jgi:hypothetical protein
MLDEAGVRPGVRATVIGAQADETIVKRVLDDEEFREALMALYETRVYRRARGDDEQITRPPGSTSARTSVPTTLSIIPCYRRAIGT